MSASLTRRGFALGAGATLFSAITARKGLTAQSQEQKVEVSAGAEIGVISPYLHSNFAEHLGSNIYNGMDAQILRNPTFVEALNAPPSHTPEARRPRRPS